MIRSHLLFLASLAIFALVSWGLSAQLMKRYTVNTELERLEREARRIEQENLTLEQFIAYSKTTAFIEREARLKKTLQREGEETIVVRGLQNQQSTSLMTRKSDTRSNPRKWMDYVMR